MSRKRGINVVEETSQNHPAKRAHDKTPSPAKQLDDNEHTLITASLRYLVKKSLKRDGSTFAISSTGRASKMIQRSYSRKKQECHFEKKQKARVTKASEDGEPCVVPYKASFLGIPREIRDLIYSYVYPRNVPPAKTTWWSYSHPPGTPTAVKDVKEYCSPMRPRCIVHKMWWCSVLKKNKCAPLQLNRQIRDEIFPVFLEDGYIHSWERSTDMPATIAWLRMLPSKHLELIRAISICPSGRYNPNVWLEFDAAVLSLSEKTNITLYYFQGDYHLNVLYRDTVYLYRDWAEWGQVEDLIEELWEQYHKHHRSFYIVEEDGTMGYEDSSNEWEIDNDTSQEDDEDEDYGLFDYSDY